jgi:purine-nucleoside phosphorylase
MLAEMTRDGWMKLLGISGDRIPRAALGFSAVDMETAATFAVAEHFGIDRGAVPAVYDNPRGEDQILSAGAEKAERRRPAQKAMVEIALAAFRKYGKNNLE